MTEDIFATTVQKTNKVLNHIEREYNWEDHRNQSYKALRAVLHTLRDRLPVNDAVALASQMTPLLKGIYYEGWDPAKVPIKMSAEEFVNKVRQEFPVSHTGSVEDLIQSVVLAIAQQIDSHEIEKVRSVLPKDIAETIV